MMSSYTSTGAGITLGVTFLWFEWPKVQPARRRAGDSVDESAEIDATKFRRLWPRLERGQACRAFN